LAKVIARKPDADVSEGVTVSFSRDQETGLFRKIEQKYTVSHLDYVSKNKKYIFKLNDKRKIDNESLKNLEKSDFFAKIVN